MFAHEGDPFTWLAKVWQGWLLDLLGMPWARVASIFDPFAGEVRFCSHA